MRELRIQLHSVQDVLGFVSLATERSFPVYVVNGNHQVNGESFMEMCSLDLRAPMVVTFQCSDEEYERFRMDAARFVVE